MVAKAGEKNSAQVNKKDNCRYYTSQPDFIHITGRFLFTRSPLWTGT
jgi:hypothetical protein